ncbi:MAG: TRAP transporter small permease [Devosia sp.]|jgi:TRAP-type C4-dicarboxylate transport system permease small subunit
MRNALRRVRAVQSVIGHAEETAGIVLVILLAIDVNLQIFARYIFHSPFIWPEEVARMLIIWMTFIGAAALARRGAEITVDTFVLMTPPPVRRLLYIYRDLALIVLFGFIGMQGFALAKTVANMPLVATGLPTSLLAWPVVIGSALTVLHCVLRLVVHAFGEDRATLHPENSPL